MRPVFASISIDAPRERVFDLLSDLSARPVVHRPLPRRVPPRAPRAGRRGRRGALSAAPLGRLAGHRDRRGRAPAPDPRGGPRRALEPVPVFTVWELSEGASPESTEVSVTFWTEPPRVTRPAPRARRARSRYFRRDFKRALVRLREIIEGDGEVERVSVAGGDRTARRSSGSASAGRICFRPPCAAAPQSSPPDRARRARVRASCVAGCGDDEQETRGRRGRADRARGPRLQHSDHPVLNPDDAEDAEYLVGQPPLKPGNSYLGVFMVIDNDTSEDAPVGDRLHRHRHARQSSSSRVESESPYALDVGAEVPAEGQLPLANTTAADGAESGLAADLPGQRRRQRQPPAAARDPDLRRRPATSSSTSSERARCRRGCSS